MYEILEVKLNVTIPNINIEYAMRLLHNKAKCPIKTFSRYMYKAEYTECGDLKISGISPLSKRSFNRDHDVIFWHGLAKYVNSGSEILWRTINDERWRYRFDGKRMMMDEPSEYVIDKLPSLLNKIYKTQTVDHFKKWIEDVSWIL